MPDIPAIWISHTMQCDVPLAPCSRNASADTYSLARTPIERTSDSSDCLIANSSSMMQTVLSCTECLA